MLNLFSPFNTVPAVEILSLAKEKSQKFFSWRLLFSYLSLVSRWANFSGVLVVGDSSAAEFAGKLFSKVVRDESIEVKCCEVNSCERRKWKLRFGGERKKVNFVMFNYHNRRICGNHESLGWVANGKKNFKVHFRLIKFYLKSIMPVNYC